MPHNLRGKPVDEQAVTTGAVISAVGCGLVSLVLVGAAATAATVSLYDHASATTGEIKKQLSTGGSNTATTVSYCPCKPDAFSNGIFAVVTGEGAKAYLEIEP